MIRRFYIAIYFRLGNLKMLRLLEIFSIILLVNLSSTWAGFACLSNPCLHGVCLDDLNSTYSCYCVDGYTGVQCQTNWDECWSNPCQNGGACIDGIAAFNCSCPEGFVGEVCEEDFNECESNPCMNNGTCQDAPNGYNCLCTIGYTGTHCEVDVAVCNITEETRCNNGGACIEGPGLTFSCRCQPGWSGLFCDAEIDECMSTPCQNGGVCLDLHAEYKCACLFGFSGRNCEEEVLVCDDNVCENDALCLMEDGHPVCYCVPDYHGDRCQFQYDECQLGPRCLNGGTCIDGIDNFTCSCPPDLTGILCECLIVDDRRLDCTYVAPTHTLPETTTEITTTYTASITTLSTEQTTLLETTESVTETTTLLETTFPTIETTTVYSTKVPETTTTETTKPDTTTEPTTIFSTVSGTEIIISTTTESSTTEEYTTTDWTTLTDIPTTKETTTENEIETSTSELTTLLSSSSSSTTTEGITIFPSTDFTAMPTQTLPFTDLLTTSTEYTTLESRESNVTIPDFFTETPTTPDFGSEEENVTSAIPLSDCSLTGSDCLNGGTCIFIDRSHKCLCPFDASGNRCETRLGITTAAFGGESYLVHRLQVEQITSIELKAKTTSNSGLLFHAALDQNYMSMYVEAGFLKFKFSCGYQTMLLSELGKPINNGNEMRISAELTFSKENNFCNATIKLNDTLSMSGDQVAASDFFGRKSAWLYLGGLPGEANVPGFIGCMSDLKISGKKINIFKDAEDGYGVAECSSLACLSNPCNNGGSCAASGDLWSCKCRNGYSGNTCEVSVCENNPCRYGGTCLPYTGSGYICLCPFGKRGHFCENELLITKPYFSSSLQGLSSFLAYPIPKGNFNRMEIKFRFAPSTLDQIAILMFIGQKGRHDFHADHMSVSFIKGYVMLTWNLGSGPRRIFTAKPIPRGKENYLVHIGRLGRRSWLYVEYLGNVTGRSPGNLVQLDVVPLIYFGGHSSANFSTLPHDLPLHSGFSGCISNAEFRSGNVVLPLQATAQTFGRAVGQCGTTECHENICQNDGACIHHGGTFACLCQDGKYGPLCSASYNPCDNFRNECASGSTCIPVIGGYECDCPVGRSGKRCETEEALTDINFSGKRSYLQLNPQLFEALKFSFEFELRPMRNRGLVFYIGSEDMFLSLSLISGLLELRILPGRKRVHQSGILVIRSNKLMVLGEWHTIKVGLYGRKIYLFVNNVVNTGLLQTSDLITLSDEEIFVGGLPDLSLLPKEATPSLAEPYKGCFRKLIVNNAHIFLNSLSIRSARNIEDCDGTPCGGDYCENSGVCWLDPNLKPHCKCQEPYQGDRCEVLEGCKGSRGCGHKGRCVGGKCVCKVGWFGALCESEITINKPKFDGNGYIMLNRRTRKRGLADTFKSLYLKFASVEDEGLLVLVENHVNSLGIGIRRGRLVIFEESNKTLNESSRRKVSDGLYHTVRLTLRPFELSLDGKATDYVFSGDLSASDLYVGGFPGDRNISMAGLTGCVAAFGSDGNNLINDFNKFDGENVSQCVV